MNARAAAAASQPGTRAADATLKVQSVRIGRDNAALQKQFGGRFYSDGSQGVNLQLLLTLSDGMVLPLSREAINIDTFVDDTFQNLISREMGYQGNAPAVSDDGSMVLFNVNTNRPPSDDATRVFVRGSLQARVVRGALKVVSGKIPLTVGEKTDVGPFKASVRSVTDNGQDRISVQVFLENEADRIQKVRATQTEGDPVLQEQESGFRRQTRTSGSTVYLNLKKKVDPIPVEISYAEKMEDVRIPFEAQVDVGVTKAGPLSAPGEKAAKPKGDVRNSRPWPPPPMQETVATLPERRQPFNPSTQPTEARKVDKIGVDVFSLTIGKPAPGEVNAVKWTNPPSQTFRASGFTVARLMISTPGVNILSLAPDGINITKFEDDKGAHETTLYQENASFPNRGYVPTSPDGQQALVSFSMTSAPTTGATKCTLAGTLKANVSRGDHVDESTPFAAEKNQSVKVGPFKIDVGGVRQQPILTPGAVLSYPYAGGTFQMFLTLSGPTERIRAIEVLDATSRLPIGQYRHTINDYESQNNLSQRQIGLPLRQQQVDQVIFRVSYYDRAEVVELPFEITTGIGL